ncbi:MAG: hypothetical protein CMF25_00795 [Kangiellaceae bacterium]|nr:hypothetical protein [Kangiellaceae bacterium]|tara:strand:+ start:2449 stop:2631 length:183 start_codon:yes stop_codon:yes gene_type:complete
MFELEDYVMQCTLESLSDKKNADGSSSPCEELMAHYAKEKHQPPSANSVSSKGTFKKSQR